MKYLLYILISLLVVSCTTRHTVTQQRDSIYIDRYVDVLKTVHDTITLERIVVQYKKDSSGQWVASAQTKENTTLSTSKKENVIVADTIESRSNTLVVEEIESRSSIKPLLYGISIGVTLIVIILVIIFFLRRR